MTPLGSPRRAAGVGQHDQVFSGVEGDFGRLGVGKQFGERRRAVALANHEHFLHARLLRGGNRLLQQRADRDEELRARIAQLICQLVGGVERVRGGDHAACQRDAVKRQRIFGQVRAVDSDHLAFTQSALSKVARHAPHAPIQLRIGECAPRVPVNHRGLVAVLQRMLIDHLRDPDFGNRYIRVWTFEHHRRTSVVNICLKSCSSCQG
jgi:hypothetical protein